MPHYSKRIAVVGGGIFGCTTAWMLGKKGYSVDLFEKNDDIITQASFINQYRLHKGYHYPRSPETAISSIKGLSSFIEEYSDAVTRSNVDHIYCIAKEKSFVSAKKYITFLRKLNLPYHQTSVDLLKPDSTELNIIADENLFDPRKLRGIVWEKLIGNEVNVILNKQIYINELDSYDMVINSTYSNMNHLLKDATHRNYQFELCEKPVVQLPEEYINKSIVIIDGPFMCLDPMSNTQYHVLGNVVHAIHSSNIGLFPDYDKKFTHILNKGIVRNPAVSNIEKFINAAQHFFIGIEKLRHIGSMYTIRTVYPNCEKDDARPTVVQKAESKLINLFSGKIGTCVDAANEVIRHLE